MLIIELISDVFQVTLCPETGDMSCADLTGLQVVDPIMKRQEAAQPEAESVPVAEFFIH